MEKVKPKNIEEVKKEAEEKMKELVENQQDLPADISEAVNEHFWELL